MTQLFLLDLLREHDDQAVEEALRRRPDRYVRIRPDHYHVMHVSPVTVERCAPVAWGDGLDFLRTAETFLRDSGAKVRRLNRSILRYRLPSGLRGSIYLDACNLKHEPDENPSADDMIEIVSRSILPPVGYEQVRMC